MKSRHCSTSCAVLKATVEEDLDDALDNLLKDTIAETEGGDGANKKLRIVRGGMLQENAVSDYCRPHWSVLIHCPLTRTWKC